MAQLGLLPLLQNQQALENSRLGNAINQWKLRQAQSQAVAASQVPQILSQYFGSANNGPAAPAPGQPSVPMVHPSPAPIPPASPNTPSTGMPAASHPAVIAQNAGTPSAAPIAPYQPYASHVANNPMHLYARIAGDTRYTPGARMQAIQMLAAMGNAQAKQALAAAEMQNTNAYRMAGLGLRADQISGNQKLGQERLAEMAAFREAQLALGENRNKIASVAAGVDPGSSKTADTVAKAIAAYRYPPLSGWVMKSAWGQKVTALIYKYNPDYSAPQYAAKNAAINRFDSGLQGNTVRSINVVFQHLNIMKDLINSLGNGNVKQINRVSQEFREQIGLPAPTSFDAAKQIVLQEVIKAVTASGGTLGDRETAEASIGRANSPKQLEGVLNTYTHLMAGQMAGLRRQFTTSTGLPGWAFDQKLSPEALKSVQHFSATDKSTKPPKSTPLPLTNAQGWKLMKDANGNMAYVGPNGQIQEVP